MVISVDPKRVVVQDAEEEKKAIASGKTLVVKAKNGAEEKVWYQCTIKGGREGRDLGEWWWFNANAN